jgi:uncharacterized protein YkuJ
MFELRFENESSNIVDVNDGINYIVTHISGLNPPSASLFTSKSPNRKGSIYNGSTLDERNVVVTIKILGDVEENRNALYEWVDTEQYIKIRYKNGMKNVFCEGYVIDCSVDLFTANEVFSVAITCPDAYLKDLNEISIDITNLLKQFTFPFAIGKEGVPFSTIREGNDTAIYNAGAETGVQFRIVCRGYVENLMIYNSNNVSETFKINTTLSPNSLVVIDTEANPKTCKEYREDGRVINLLKYVKNPTWFQLKKGINKFGYISDTPTESVEMSIKFTNNYLGV